MNDYTKGESFPCGCYIEYYEGWKDKPDHIIYCPLHKSAPRLYEALERIRAITPKTIIYDIANTALAEVEGKETKPSPWGLTREEVKGQ